MSRRLHSVNKCPDLASTVTICYLMPRSITKCYAVQTTWSFTTCCDLLEMDRMGLWVSRFVTKWCKLSPNAIPYLSPTGSGPRQELESLFEKLNMTIIREVSSEFVSSFLFRCKAMQDSLLTWDASLCVCVKVCVCVCVCVCGKGIVTHEKEPV